ncbi:hypothetical protein [Alistipes sp.]|uniref:hypothetical protein n=1 Tax=Alistipes sp. TaxID=1872444 RepID=UPI0039779B4F
MLVKFVKYEGAGNDFILIDDREGAFRPDAGHIAALCDRHFGIGADGLMTLRRSSELDCSMRYYNADGSAGEMCGNGARCFALFAEHLGIGGETKYFDATDGVHTAHIRRAHRMINIGNPQRSRATERSVCAPMNGASSTRRWPAARVPRLRRS